MEGLGGHENRALPGLDTVPAPAEEAVGIVGANATSQRPVGVKTAAARAPHLVAAGEGPMPKPMTVVASEKGEMVNIHREASIPVDQTFGKRALELEADNEGLTSTWTVPITD